MSTHPLKKLDQIQVEAAPGDIVAAPASVQKVIIDFYDKHALPQASQLRRSNISHGCIGDKVRPCVYVGDVEVGFSLGGVGRPMQHGASDDNVEVFLLGTLGNSTFRDLDPMTQFLVAHVDAYSMDPDSGIPDDAFHVQTNPAWPRSAYLVAVPGTVRKDNLRTYLSNRPTPQPSARSLQSNHKRSTTFRLVPGALEAMLEFATEVDEKWDQLDCGEQKAMLANFKAAVFQQKMKNWGRTTEGASVTFSQQKSRASSQAATRAVNVPRLGRSRNGRLDDELSKASTMDSKSLHRHEHQGQLSQLNPPKAASKAIANREASSRAKVESSIPQRKNMAPSSNATGISQASTGRAPSLLSNSMITSLSNSMSVLNTGSSPFDRDVLHAAIKAQGAAPARPGKQVPPFGSRLSPVVSRANSLAFDLNFPPLPHTSKPKPNPRRSGSIASLLSSMSNRSIGGHGIDTDRRVLSNKILASNSPANSMISNRSGSRRNAGGR